MYVFHISYFTPTLNLKLHMLLDIVVLEKKISHSLIACFKPFLNYFIIELDYPKESKTIKYSCIYF